LTANFDKYVNDYKEIINRVSKVSGEQYEYFIKLRISLMKARISEKISVRNKLSILDFGCGIGVTEIFIRDSFSNSIIFGLDTSQDSITEAEKLGLPDVNFMMLKSSAFPFEDNYFDLIYSNGTLHHMEHDCHHSVLQEMLRVLKKGGDIFIFENNPFNPLMMRAMKNNPFDKEAKVVYPNNLSNNLKNAGFRLNAVQYYFFFPHFLKFLRVTEKYLSRVPLGAQYFIWASK
jgi:ubiquinone/menaquinone biosynthesis C-methylase UbiE